MPRTESSSAVSQDYLDFYYLSSAITFLGSGLGPQYKNGPGPQIIGPHINHFVSLSSSFYFFLFKIFNFIKKNTNILLKTLNK